MFTLQAKYKEIGQNSENSGPVFTWIYSIYWTSFKPEFIAIYNPHLHSFRWNFNLVLAGHPNIVNIEVFIHECQHVNRKNSATKLISHLGTR